MLNIVYNINYKGNGLKKIVIKFYVLFLENGRVLIFTFFNSWITPNFNFKRLQRLLN